MEVVYLFLIIGSILIIGFLADSVFKRYGIPDVIILLLVGLLLRIFIGELEVKIISTNLILLFSALALMFILFEVGTEMKFYYLIKEIPKASLLAFSIFFISMLSVTLLSNALLGFGMNLALLLGAIVGGSSSAVVAPMMSKLEISRDTKSLLTIESALTDALCVLVAIALLESLTYSGSIGLGVLPGEIISSFSIAIVLGFIFGLFWLKVLPKIEKYEYYYLLTIGMLFFVYSLSEIVGGIGAISSLIFGVVLGNVNQISKMLYIKDAKPLTPTTNIFHKLIVFIIRVFFFVVLGLIINISNPVIFLYGVLITGVLFGLRISISKWIVFNQDKPEKNLVAIMMPRGLAAAVLAPLPYVQYGIESAYVFPDLVFSIILVSSLIACVGLRFLNFKIAPLPQNKK